MSLSYLFDVDAEGNLALRNTFDAGTGTMAVPNLNGILPKAAVDKAGARLRAAHANPAAFRAQLDAAIRAIDALADLDQSERDGRLLMAVIGASDQRADAAADDDDLPEIPDDGRPAASEPA